MYPIDCSGIVFYPFARSGIVLHDLPCTDFPVDVYLPKYDFLIFCRSQGIVFDCSFDLVFGEIVTEKTNKVGIIGR